MRLTDALLRRGHLSEEALAEVCLMGMRPAHLDHCDICDERALELGRWLEGVREAGVDAADHAFSTDMMAAQQTQILRRLEQLDQPSRVISFPGFSRRDVAAVSRRRIAPAWIGVAAAAGIVLGIVGEQVTLKLGERPSLPTAPTQPAAEQLAAQTAGLATPGNGSSVSDADLLDRDFNQVPSSVLGPSEKTAPILVGTTARR